MEYMHNINNFAEVTFETKCWENDWKLMLKTEHLKRMIDNCNYQFANKVLFINNVDHYEKVGKYALRAKNRGIINAYYNVKDYAEEVLKYFDLSREAFFFGGGVLLFNSGISKYLFMQDQIFATFFKRFLYCL